MFAHTRWISLRRLMLLQLLLVIPIMCLPTIEQTNTQRSLNRVTQYEQKTVLYNRPELEDTIEEVQKILAQDPSLPRLTRGEIEELYEKVTREEYEKSIRAGDIGRADSMRALMLVLPYNTDNNTEENLQELYTRPPVTKVIDVYTPPQPIQFVTADPSSAQRSETVPVGQMSATTYKPVVKVTPADFSPTTYHPMKTFTHTTSSYRDSVKGFKPIPSGPLPVYNYALNAAHVAQTVKPGQRFSSHYNAENADFLKQTRPKVITSTSTVKPMADVLESFGIVGKTNFRNHPEYYDDYYPAESAPQSVISTYVPQTVSVAQLQELHAQNLGPRNRPDAYSSFKPLNIGEEIRIRPEVEGYLTRFGIVANRKRKAIKKQNEDENNHEPASEESELSPTKILSTDSSKRARKGVDNKTNDNSELEKLLENLQELERLNINPKLLKTTMTTTTTSTLPPPTTTTTKRAITTTTTPTTTTMKIATSTVRDLITNGAPMLIEAKKPVRRIDPNFDLNYGASSNKQTQDTQNNSDQLEKLLENLQELQKLRINPENVLKTVVVPPIINRLSTTTQEPVTTTRATQTTAAIRAMTIINRFSDARYQEQQQQKQLRDTQQLEEMLKQLQAAEQNRKITSSTSTTTTKRPTKTNALGLNDLSQLRRLLGNDSELERLYNNARDRFQPAAKITTTTTTTSTTSKPDMAELADLENLQKYLELLERTTTTTTSKPITTTTAITTRKPTTTETTVKKPFVGNDQILELINRVQELERANAKKITPTQSPNLPFLGFTSRNVNSPKSVDNAFFRSSNDFAQLQQLYKKVQDAEQSSYGTVEISTPTTVAKVNAQTNRSKSQDFTQRIIDITNDTGSGSSLLQVDSNEFVHLQKLLKKVQELERVKIGPDGIVKSMTSAPTAKIQREITERPTLSTFESEKVSVYAVPAKKVEDYVASRSDFPSVKISLPVYQETTTTKATVRKNEPLQSSSEELRELVMSPPTKSNNLSTDSDFEQYQEFFSNLEDNERNAYKNLQPPVIQKTVTKEPPRFVVTRRPQEISKINVPQSQNELKELQKLLNNAQELEKLGVTLPSILSKKIETKLVDVVDETNSRHGFKKIPTVTAGENKLRQNPEVERYLEKYGILDAKDDNSKISTTSNEITTNGNELNDAKAETAVFSLTTIKPQATTKEPRTTTESAVQLPIFSATKIIEAAIKRAANKIGVSTEKTLGFRRRSDTDMMEMDTDDGDLMAEFSEINYQIASPEKSSNVNDANTQSSKTPKGNTSDAASVDITKDLGELQRLIANLQELQKLNITTSADTLRIADAAYLESFKNKSNSETDVSKNRRQSESFSTAATMVVSSSTTDDVISPTTPTRVNLDLSFDKGDTKAEATDLEMSTSSTATSTTTEESRNGAISDLEDSFGPDPNAEAQPPLKKKNGFYFLADWNSFLEVGDGDDQVVVRFSPKIGDPRLFIPVKIP